jgi:hypothetical protein
VVSRLLNPAVDEVVIVMTRLFGAGVFAWGLACLMARDHVGNPVSLTVAYKLTA